MSAGNAIKVDGLGKQGYDRQKGVGKGVAAQHKVQGMQYLLIEIIAISMYWGLRMYEYRQLYQHSANKQYDDRIWIIVAE